MSGFGHLCDATAGENMSCFPKPLLPILKLEDSSNLQLFLFLFMQQSHKGKTRMEWSRKIDSYNYNLL